MSHNPSKRGPKYPILGSIFDPFLEASGRALPGPVRLKADLPRILACNGPVWAKGAQTLKIGVQKVVQKVVKKGSKMTLF